MYDIITNRLKIHYTDIVFINKQYNKTTVYIKHQQKDKFKYLLKKQKHNYSKQNIQNLITREIE